MYRARMSTLQEARILFDAIDMNGDASVSIQEFLYVLSTAAPIASLEDFRGLNLTRDVQLVHFRRMIIRHQSLYSAIAAISEVWPSRKVSLDLNQFIKTMFKVLGIV